MKNTYLIIMLLACFFFNSTNAQNLVPNASFEVYDTCPDLANQVYHCLGWENWLGTPDYYNACAPCCASSVPYNLHNIDPNFQIPHSGDAYMGYFNYWTRAYIFPYPFLREHIAIQLAQPMQAGSTYNFSMNISLTDYFNGPCASNKIGIKFTTQSYSIYGNQFIAPLINNTASIYFDTLVTDTANWVKLSGLFVADSAYQYIVIGNFFDDFNTDTLILDTNFSLCYSYYFVDDVWLSVTTSIGEADNSNPLKIFPNPARDWIEVRGSEIKELVIYDVLGNLCYKAAGDFASPQRINISNLSNGIYILQLSSAKQIFTKKIIKQ